MLRGVAPDVTERNLDKMLTRLKDRCIAVLLVGMRAAPNLGVHYADAFNGIYPQLASKHGVPLYPFFLDGVAADPSFLLQDRMHPNAAGIDRMVERMLPEVEKLIRQ
jgi:acyl-CoA thioesterase I